LVVHPPPRIASLWSARATQAALAAALLGAVVVQMIAEPGTWPWLVVFILAPDLPLLAGMRHDGVRGRLNPRAVPAYNAVHVYWGPALLGAASLALGPAALTGALAWGLHIAIDRTVGYRLRTRSGDQRPRP
jgi:hypothetical protein